MCCYGAVTRLPKQLRTPTRPAIILTHRRSASANVKLVSGVDTACNWASLYLMAPLSLRRVVNSRLSHRTDEAATLRWLNAPAL
jgi:hypothetical protein